MIFAANWKLNKTSKEMEVFFSTFLKSNILKKALQDKKKIIFFPQALLSAGLSQIFNQFLNDNPLLVKDHLSWGLQNTFYHNEGAFTGENSALTMKEMGGQFSLVGHSERRSLFKETNKEVSKKLVLLQQLGVVPILCFGESLELRQSGEYKDFILQQLKESLLSVDLSKRIILAYEPIWAIGTGKQASTEDIQEIGTLIKEKFPKLELLYGGSVKPSNVKAIVNQKEISGVLVGGASLDPQVFLELISSCYNS
ncbi:MAG: triosephosphate isomerase [Bdellovibrionaceae bacterium]|nr:triosephosphate isomerase [Pseudobdellovibrionaceae bacterium]